MRRLIVVGSGVAGLTAALTARATGCEVTLVTKSALTESNSYYAQGGVAAALWDDDTVASHVSDTLRAGAGLCDPEAVRVLCGDGPERIRELIGLGVGFDRTDGALARGLEAAHSSPRILHAGGDATGRAIETSLVRALVETGARVREHTFLIDLIVRDGTVCGIRTLGADGGTHELDADAVVLASGGAGRMFAHTTNPPVATGDGTAAAYRAGAQLADVEFYQFHPTALAGPASGSFLISEAVRGEGAVLVNSAGHRFLRDVHPDAELAPRDVVARGIAIEMAAQGGTPVRLDATGLGRRFLAERFPTIDAACRRAGLDWADEPVPVTPAAHYWMGGIATDTTGRTSLPGLYAVGEAACTGAHGANRLASNSLLEALVFAHRAAVDAARGGSPSAWPATLGRVTADESLDAPDPGDPGAASIPVERDRLQSLMWSSAGLHRNGPALEEAAAILRSLRAERDPLAGRAALEDANLLDLSRVVTAAALARRESRGAHFRTDHPASSSDGARHRAWARKVTVPC